MLLTIGDEGDDPGLELEGPHSDVVLVDISNLHSLVSQLQSRSLRVTEVYGQHSFPILIDIWSTHNFIKPMLIMR